MSAEVEYILILSKLTDSKAPDGKTAGVTATVGIDVGLAGREVSTTSVARVTADTYRCCRSHVATGEEGPHDTSTGAAADVVGGTTMAGSKTAAGAASASRYTATGWKKDERGSVSTGACTDGEERRGGGGSSSKGCNAASGGDGSDFGTALAGGEPSARIGTGAGADGNDTVGAVRDDVGGVSAHGDPSADGCTVTGAGEDDGDVAWTGTSTA